MFDHFKSKQKKIHIELELSDGLLTYDAYAEEVLGVISALMKFYNAPLESFTLSQ